MLLMFPYFRLNVFNYSGCLGLDCKWFLACSLKVLHLNLFLELVAWFMLPPDIWFVRGYCLMRGLSGWMRCNP